MQHSEELQRIGEILKRLRETLELSQEAFGEEYLGLSQSHTAKLERGKFALKGRNIDKLAKKQPAEAERIRELVRAAKGLANLDAAPPPKRSKTRDEGFAPVVGRVSCGTLDEILSAGRAATGEADMRPIPYPTRDKQAAWIEAWGDSMTGELIAASGEPVHIHQGDWLFVEPSRRPANGKPALVEVDGEATVKLWREHKDGVELIPTNPKHRVRFISKDDAREIRAWRITFHDPRPRPL